MAKFEDKLKKWYVEGQTGVTDIVINAQPSHGVFISKNKDSVVTVKGKVGSICVESCQGSGIIFDDVVSSVDVVNCKKIQLQANGVLALVAIDKTTGVTVFLQSPASQKADIATSLATEINVVVPGKTENDDSVEHPVPAQFVSKFVKGKFVTTAVEHV